MPRIAVIGLGRFGSRLARTVTEAGAEVIGIDRDREIIERIRDQVTLAVRLDATDKEALKRQGVGEVDVAVVGIGHEFESAALITSLLKDMKVPLIICRAETSVRAEILKRIGADETVSPEAESAERWAHRLIMPKLQDYVELGEGHSLVQIDAPEKFQNKTPGELNLRRSYGVNLVAIRRRVSVQSGTAEAAHDAGVITIPTADTKILASDTLILIGSDESLSQLPQG